MNSRTLNFWLWAFFWPVLLPFVIFYWGVKFVIWAAKETA